MDNWHYLTGHYTNEINTFAGYPQPLTVKGIQNIYGSDLQVAYDDMNGYLDLRCLTTMNSIYSGSGI